MNFLVSALIGTFYGALLGTREGACAFALVLLTLFCVDVATTPLSLETKAQKRERESFKRQVVAMLLICAVFGAAIAGVLLP